MQVWRLSYGTNDLLLEDRELSPLHWWDVGRLVGSENFFSLS